LTKHDCAHEGIAVTATAAQFGDDIATAWPKARATPKSPNNFIVKRKLEELGEDV
jgi:hypothetical protein